MEERRKASPGFYGLMSILFFAIGAALIWFAAIRREWFLGVMGGITLLNSLMCTLRYFVARELGR